METKAFASELKADHDKREIEGYAAIFDTLDHGRDVIIKGAFERTIREDFAAPGSGQPNNIKGLWYHQKLEPIGRPTDMAEDSKGLHFRMRLTKGVQRADEVLALVADDVVDQMSFGFDTRDSAMGDFHKGADSIRARFLKDLKVWELSPVTWGMNGGTSVAQAKALSHLVGELKAGRRISKATLAKLEAAVEQQEAALGELRELLEAAISERDESASDGEDGDGEKAGGFASVFKSLERFDDLITKRLE